jgi:glutamyl/glutaminyl-tRNA synthetase
MPESPVVTRFAPSPTGHLHIGGARTALFCWAFARGLRKRGGDARFMIRIEDTDQARSSESSTRGILEDLAWLGIEWDDGPELAHGGRTIGGDARGVGSFYQSRRLAIYNHWIDWLVDHGHAYPAFETSDELEVKRRAAVAAKQTYRYDRAALTAIPQGERRARMAAADKAGTPYVVRFRMPDEGIKVVDEVLGEVSYGAGEVDDFVIRKADGFPTYHFAVVIDDETMGVTHVLRGQEHLNNTPKHVALQHALKHPDGRVFRTPVYAHMPLIFNNEGAKMSKREKDKAAREVMKKRASQRDSETASQGEDLAAVAGVPADVFGAWLKDSQKQLPTDALERLAAHIKIQLPEIEVEDFRKAGYLPEVICNFIALLGWSPGGDVEKFDMEYLADKFDLGRIGKTNAKFDRVKLLSFNVDAITGLSAPEFQRRWAEWCRSYAPEFTRLPECQLALLASAIQPRCKTFRDAAEQARFILVADDAVVFDDKAVEKTLRKGEPTGAALLKDLRPVLAALPGFSAPEIHAAIESFAADRCGGNMGKIAQPLRVALTGGTISPPIDATLAVLGRERVLKRIDRCLAAK